MFKKLILLFTLLLSVSTAFAINSITAEASTATEVEEVSAVEEGVEEVEDEVINEGQPSMRLNDFRTRKVNVNIGYMWSGYKQVSDYMKTGSQGGSISSTSEVTFGTEVSGDISGLGISVSGSKTSSVGYTLNADPNKTVYMGYRVYWKIETGTREVYDTLNGKVLKSNSYVVKTPQTGEYRLLYVINQTKAETKAD